MEVGAVRHPPLVEDGILRLPEIPCTKEVPRSHELDGRTLIAEDGQPRLLLPVQIQFGVVLGQRPVRVPPISDSFNES